MCQRDFLELELKNFANISSLNPELPLILFTNDKQHVCREQNMVFAVPFDISVNFTDHKSWRINSRKSGKMRKFFMYYFVPLKNCKTVSLFPIKWKLILVVSSNWSFVQWIQIFGRICLLPSTKIWKYFRFLKSRRQETKSGLGKKIWVLSIFLL